MTKTHVLTAIAALCLLCSASTFGQVNEFRQTDDEDWHRPTNWSLLHVPPDEAPFEDVLILSGKTCKILTDIAHAKSVEVEATAKLGVENSEELYIHATEAAPTALTIDGTLYFRGTYGTPDVPATLRLAVTAQFQEDVHLVFTGDGVITAAKADDPSPTTEYGPAHLVTPAGRETDP